MNHKIIKTVCLFFVFVLLLTCCKAENTQLPPSKQSDMQQSEQINPPNGEKMFVVGVSWQGMTAYVQRLEKIMKALANESDYVIRFIWMDGQNNAEKQISQVENFIAHKVDLILLNPSTYNNLAPAVTASEKASIPLITIITKLREQEHCTSYVGSDHMESAVLQGMAVGNFLNGKGKIAILEGTVGIEAQLARSAGYNQILSKFNNIKVIANQPAFWEQDDAYVIVENWLYNGIMPDVIMSQNDNMAIGALEAVKDAGLADRVKVFGIDGDKEAVQSIRDGGMAGTVFMDAYGQAKCIFQCLDAVKNKAEVKKEYIVPFIVLGQENINNPNIQDQLQY